MREPAFGWSRNLIVRLVVPLLSAILVGSVVAVLAMSWILRKEATRELQHRGDLLATKLALDAELPVLAHDEDSIEMLIEDVLTDPDVVDAEVLLSESDAPQDSTGTLAETGLLHVEVPIVAEYFDASPFSPSSIDRFEPEEIGRVRLVLSDARFRERQRPLLRTLFASGMCMLALGVLLARAAMLSYRRSLRPLVQATERLSAGALHTRIREETGDSDLRHLAASFNQMASDLERAQQELLEERYSLEQRVTKRTAELEKAQRSLVETAKISAVGQLVAGVAHELNTPLTVLVGYSDLLLRDDLSPKHQDQLATMKNAAVSSKRIVQNLLSFARNNPARRRTTSFNEVVECSLALRKYSLETSGVEVVLNLDESIPETWADFHQLQQVVVNLLTNAEHAVSEHAENPKIEVFTRYLEGRLRLKVADNGIGMDAETQKRIFEPFFSTKDIGEGTGLGLSICYGIIAEHGGEISVNSVARGGTEFTVEIERLEPPKSLPSTGEYSRSGGLDQLRVLAIDDDEFILGFVEDVLGPTVADIVTARGGAEAIEVLAKDQCFDVILCDMRMPEINGRDFYEHLLQVHPELVDRLILATGDTANEDTSSFLEESRVVFVAKPFAPQDLVRGVRRLGLGTKPVVSTAPVGETHCR